MAGSNTGDKDILALNGLKYSCDDRKSSEAFNIVHFWKIFLIKSFRRIYFKGPTVRKANLTEF
jgi:hypothetical protein